MPRKLTTEEFITKAKKVHGERYDYSNVEYIRSHDEVKIICNKQNHGVFEQSPNNHLNGSGCPRCAKRYSYSNTEFIEKCEHKHNNKYDYSKVRYHNTMSKIIIICKIHGEFKQRADAHLRGAECPCCKDNIPLTTKEFVKRARKKHKNKYDYSLARYKTNRLNVKIVCKKHGVFEQSPTNHLRGSGCPICRTSFGENVISKILNKYNFIYERQYTYNDLRGISNGKLKFDFYVPKLNMCIEYDGIQHFKHMEGWISKETYNTTVKHDKLKNEYCHKNNIRLLRIPYTEFDNIESILSFEFNQIL